MNVYILLAGILLLLFSAAQLAQNIYIMILANRDDPDSLRQNTKKWAFWGILGSSILLAIGILMITFTVYVHYKVKSTKQSTLAEIRAFKEYYEPPMSPEPMRRPERVVQSTEYYQDTGVPDLRPEPTAPPYYQVQETMETTDYTF